MIMIILVIITFRSSACFWLLFWHILRSGLNFAMQNNDNDNNNNTYIVNIIIIVVIIIIIIIIISSSSSSIRRQLWALMERYVHSAFASSERMSSVVLHRHVFDMLHVLFGALYIVIMRMPCHALVLHWFYTPHRVQHKRIQHAVFSIECIPLHRIVLRRVTNSAMHLSCKLVGHHRKVTLSIACMAIIILLSGIKHWIINS